ncbi:IS66 family transposase [Blautia sp. AF19-10LB]|uniref:IS66 family transposase n=1 Tax=Blautia sp. AF19-10LB TaxID=2292961 RepID=UPI0018F73824
MGISVEKGKDFLSYYHYHKFDKKYDELIEQARKENPLPKTTEKKRGRKKKGKILALVERLANYKASVCLFIHNFNVPFDNNQAERDLRMIKVKTKVSFDNNQAERDLRMIKVKTKVSGCFRTEKGARDYLKIMSYVGTAHKQGYNAYKAIKNAITGHPDFIFE